VPATGWTTFFLYIDIEYRVKWPCLFILIIVFSVKLQYTVLFWGDISMLIYFYAHTSPLWSPDPEIQLPKRPMAIIQCGPSGLHLERKLHLGVCDPEGSLFRVRRLRRGWWGVLTRDGI